MAASVITMPRAARQSSRRGARRAWDGARGTTATVVHPGVVAVLVTHGAPGPAAPRRTLAHKLERLFHTMHPKDRGEYSLEEVAEGIRQRGGPTISATYIWQLRKGLKDNPTKKHLEALADFFGVSPLYFFDDEAAARIDAELRLLIALRDGPVRHLALRDYWRLKRYLGICGAQAQWVREVV